jgi:hypothetical protein
LVLLPLRCIAKSKGSLSQARVPLRLLLPVHMQQLQLPVPPQPQRQLLQGWAHLWFWLYNATFSWAPLLLATAAGVRNARLVQSLAPFSCACIATSKGRLQLFSLAYRPSHMQPLLVATFACDLATQLMPAAHPPAKYLCLLLATFAFDLRNAKAQVQPQLMPGAHKQGRQQGRHKQQAAYAAA